MVRSQNREVRLQHCSVQAPPLNTIVSQLNEFYGHHCGGLYYKYASRLWHHPLQCHRFSRAVNTRPRAVILEHPTPASQQNVSPIHRELRKWITLTDIIHGGAGIEKQCVSKRNGKTLNIKCPSRSYRRIFRFSYRLLLQYFCLPTEFTWCSASNSLQQRKDSRHGDYAMGWTIRGSTSGRSKKYFLRNVIPALGSTQDPAQ